MHHYFYVFVFLIFHQLAFSQGASFDSDELITRVNFGLLPFDNTDLLSPNTGTNSIPCSGYSDFTIGNSNLTDGNILDLVHTLGIAKTLTYELEIEGGYCDLEPSITNGTRGVKVYIDFNANNDFSDAGELVYTSPLSSSTTPIFNTSVTIPTNAATGEIVMRVVYLRVGGVSGAGVLWDLDWLDWSQWPYNYGETEDYTLVVTAYIDSVESVNTSCSNTSDGQLIINPSPFASSGIEYSINGFAGPWSTDLVYSNLPSGNYTVVARDPALAPDYAYEEYQAVIEPASDIVLNAQIASDYNGFSISCTGVSDGEVNLSAVGGGASFTYEYTSLLNPIPTSTPNFAIGLIADTYTFVAYDNLGCASNTVELTLNEPAPLNITNLINSSPISCNSACDAEITVVASGGTSPLNYTVGGVDFGPDNIASNLCQGSVSVLVEDANDCSLQLTSFIGQPSTVNTSVASAVDNSGYDISCANVSDGVLEIITSGGTGNYQISIDGGLTFPFSSSGLDSIFNLSAGSYSIVAQDENACLSTPSDITLSQPPVLSLDLISESSSISCFGFSDGEVEVQASGGAGAYSYSLDGGLNSQVSNVLSNLSSANLNIEVYDGNGCVAQASYFLNEPDPITINSASVVSSFNGADISCFGASDGVVEVDGEGGVGTYSYTFISDFTQYNFTSGNQITGLSADLYTLQLIDENQCYSNLLDFEITSPPPLSIDDISSTMTSCFSNCDGELTITASGGVSPLNYTVGGLDFGSNNVVSDLCQGLSTVLVEDVNGCDIQTNTLITSPPAINLTLLSASDYLGYDVSCSNSTDGVIEYNVTGGMGNYSISTDGGLTFPFSSSGLDSIFNLSAGSYSITAQDENTCLSSPQVIDLQAPPSLSVNLISETTPISCAGNSDGEITIQASGGAGAYSYSLDGGLNSQVSNVLSNLSSANLNIEVYDGNGCVAQASYFLNEPDPITINSASVVSSFNGADISCFGASDAVVEVNAVGGTGTYTYSFLPSLTQSNFSSDNQITGLSAGVYSLQLADANQCLSNSVLVEVQSPDELIVNNVTAVEVNCFGGTDGQLIINAQGGIGAYNYVVDGQLYSSTDQSPFTISNLFSNDYNIIVSDANGCQTTTSQFVSQPTPLVANISVSNVGCSSSLDGSASVNPTGGVQDYNVLWSTGSTGFNLNQLGSGNYSVTVTDANNCQLTESFEITEPFISLSPNTILCSGSSTGQIQATIFNANPFSVFSALWNDANAQTGLTAINLSPGEYTLTLTDQFGCVLTATESLDEPDSLVVLVEHSQLCEDKPVASALVLASGGATPYSYVWSSGEQSELIQLSDPGSFSVEVTDLNGCKQDASFNIEPISPLNLSFITEGVSCVDNIDGSVEVFVNGGYSPYTFEWDNFVETPLNEGLPSGSIGLTVTDNHGCTSVQQASIPSSDEVCIKPFSAFSPNGDMNNDYWHIDNIELYPDGLVEVFNRWGDRVYSTKRYINAWDGAWDGTFDNQLLPSATYYYVINLNNGEEPLIGTVTIVR